MTAKYAAKLVNRACIKIEGEQAVAFLQNLVTCDISELEADQARFGALLTAQGKILFDFIIYRTHNGLLLETARERVSELIKRLTFYKLRAKIVLTDHSDDIEVWALWGQSHDAAIHLELEQAASAPDPRLSNLGRRLIANKEQDMEAAFAAAGFSIVSAKEYHTHRIHLGVPEAGVDYAYDDVFPHDVDMDGLNGVAFDKGCFIGQEVVSRMQHRGTARKRVIQVSAEQDLPPMDTPILAGGKPVGAVKSSHGSTGLALVRLDRICDARANAVETIANERPLTFSLPSWANFTWPDVS